MEPKYVCSFKQSKTVLRDFFLYTFYKSRGVLLLYAAVVIGAVLSYMNWKATGKPGDISVLVPGAFIIQFFLYLKTSGSAYEKSKKSDGSECTETVEFYDDKLVVKTDMGVYESYEYSSISRVVKSGSVIMLKTSAGAYVVLEKNGFVGSSADKVLGFLADKGIKI